MSSIARNCKILVSKQLLQRSSFSTHSSASSHQIRSVALPSNVEDIAAGDKVCFSSSRHRDLSHGVAQGQMASVFGNSFMSSQFSQIGESDQNSSSVENQLNGELSHLDNYDSLGAINLNAVMTDNVPMPFSPIIDKLLTPHLNVPISGQQNKYIANDMQETLYAKELVQSKSQESHDVLSNAWQPIRNSTNLSTSNRYYSTSPTNPDSVTESTKTKLKRAVRDYGATVIVFHVTMSITSLGICYAAVASGLDIPALFTQMGIGGELLSSKLASGASTFLVAYAVHKVMAPIRISITLGSVPFIVRYLRKIGFLKNPPTEIKKS